MNVWKLIAEKGREVFSSKIIYVDKECKAFFFFFFFFVLIFYFKGVGELRRDIYWRCIRKEKLYTLFYGLPTVFIVRFS